MQSKRCYSPKHHKKASKATTSVNEVKGFNEFRRFRGTKTRTSENSQLLNSSSVTKIMSGTVPPIQFLLCGRQQTVTFIDIELLKLSYDNGRQFYKLSVLNGSERFNFH